MFGKLPIFVRRHAINLPEVMYYLYLPVRMDGSDVRLPGALEVCRPLIEDSLEFTRSIYRDKPDYRYVYLSARKGWATPDNPLNRPGWHCDGFGTNDLNFVWWHGPGTRFALQAFKGIVSDHNRSMEQFGEQVRPDNVVTYGEHGLYALDSSVVHSTPIIPPPGCMRQYIKVSLSDHPYNLENNSHNYLFNYNWPMYSRAASRNDTYIEET